MSDHHALAVGAVLAGLAGSLALSVPDVRRREPVAHLAALAAGQDPLRRTAGWSDFPVFVWRLDRAEDEHTLRFARAFGATNLGRGEDGAGLAARGLAFYVDNAAGRDELHLDRDARRRERSERWFATRDDALLVREPCLNDPDVRERLRATLARTLARPAAGEALGFSLGDEVSFTPYGGPEDTCLCAHCAEAWREFLARARADGATLLPGDFELARASTDAARHALEAGDPAPVEAWLLRREFTQATVQARLAELAARARALRAGARLGLMGMIGRTAFGGVGLPRVLPLLDFAECYRVGDARELLFTLRGPGVRVVQTIFFDERSPSAPVWCAFEAWARGADGLVLWSDRDLAGRPGYFEALLRTVAALRALEARAPEFAPRPQGVALVNDERSIAYGWLVDARLDGPTWPRRLQGWQERRGSRERSLRAWLRVLEDCGAMPGAVPLESVGAATVERFPVLVLNHLRVLDARGAERLREFQAAGGRLLVRGDLGVVDPRGRAAPKPPLDALREGAPGAVALFGEELDLYAEERLLGGAALRERVARELAAGGAAVAPWRMANDGPASPWLCTWARAADGSVLCAALPNLPEGAERESAAVVPGLGAVPHLRELRATVEVPAGFDLRWLHPRDAEGRSARLPAGEAAVFRLTPVESR